MEKLNLKILEKICGKGTWAISTIDLNQPIAVTAKKSLNNNNTFRLAFNPGEPGQIRAILAGNPYMKWIEEINDADKPFYSRDLLHQWFPKYPVKKLYNPWEFVRENPTPPIPEIFNVK